MWWCQSATSPAQLVFAFLARRARFQEPLVLLFELNVLHEVVIVDFADIDVGVSRYPEIRGPGLEIVRTWLKFIVTLLLAHLSVTALPNA
jgi:hypothetical protein